MQPLTADNVQFVGEQMKMLARGDFQVEVVSVSVASRSYW